ncbi:MAG TPA: UDP-N-acetylglucosamine 1-carboxyvinyltransferase [Micropepsaceae bacterium]|jgi:UDP-N-acetylglucosamine 1-carboxyvinyltransferase|nr:UDP-N-acetylglucosamine 1-carboxyvinyltransferase [Micropepsaceae bacterium]
MDRIRIAGGRRLKGEIPISGAKNAALPLMAACLLSESPLTLTNVPNLADVVYMADVLRQLGVGVAWQMSGPDHVGGVIKLQAPTRPQSLATYDAVRKMRASFLVLGPLVARVREAMVSLPGGCAIGARPVDLHLKGLAAMGAEIELTGGYVLARAPHGLKGAEFEFPSVSVGATENLMMAASLAKGRTVLINAAREPEIGDLGHCLIAMGAKISGLGSSTIIVDGVPDLGPATHAVLPDRIETGTYAIAAAIAGGEVELTGTTMELIGALVPLLRRTGVEVETTSLGFAVGRNGAGIRAADVATEPFPGFPTDLQAQYMALMCTAEGTSHIRETIFENRFMHVPELLRMGAEIKVEGDTATVTGHNRLKGAPVMATDLRASVSLVLAGLAAEGETIVNRVYHLDRGFERIEQKLKACGADIERLKE